MLRVTTLHASGAGSSARYYTRYLADDGPEGPGVWLGRQAGGLGLAGEVTNEDREALLSGHDPVTGTRLGLALVDRFDSKGKLIPAVAGFDATFSAPKSVSVWWALTGDARLLDANDAAVRAVLEHLERYGSTTRVRVNGARQHPDTGGLVTAAFRQTTSREDDPQLHTHVVISTKVQTADGRWLALDARHLKRKQRALGGLYQSVLRAELTHRFGVAWGPVTNGQAELAGLPAELLGVFSKRTTQVDDAVAVALTEFRDREGRDPTRQERAALTRRAAEDSRASKTHLSPAELAPRWRREAADAGWTTPRLTRSLTTAAAREAPAPTPSLTIADVVEQLTTTGFTWTRADVVQAICDLAPPVSQRSGHDWARLVEGAADRMLAACVDLDPPDPAASARASDGRSLWIAPIESHLTHETVLAQEERILLYAHEAVETPASPSATVRTEGLDVLQADAAVAVAGHDRLVLVVGRAGTGKTTTLRAAADDLSRTGRAVFGVAPTAKAAKVLHDETAIPADTLAKLLYEWRKPVPGHRWRLSPASTVIVDEAGMVGTGALDELTTLAVSQHWRLVLVGDPRQLQTVGRGGMFDELCGSVRAHELATIHRFHHRWEQAASLRLRSGDPAALDAYLGHDRVRAGTFDDLAERAAHRWARADAVGHTVAVVAETNEHVDALNAAIQDLRARRGDLGPEHTRIAGTETAHVGDRVVTRRNDRALVTDRHEPVRNRDRWTVQAVGADGSLAVAHDQGHGAVVLPADYVRSDVRLGYAATAYGNQGDTVDLGIMIVTAGTSHRSLYVGATRGRADNQIYVVTDDPDRARDVLEQALTNDRADQPAVVRRRELLHQTPRPEPADPKETLARAERHLREVQRRAEPYLQPLDAAEIDLAEAKRNRWDAERTRATAPRWRRPLLARPLADATAAVEDAQIRCDTARADAAPALAELNGAQAEVRRAEIAIDAARMRDRLDRLMIQPPTRTIDHRLGIEL
ncbi:MAG: MobF family relaxase [Acidimicrobiales bacterium]